MAEEPTSSTEPEPTPTEIAASVAMDAAIVAQDQADAAEAAAQEVADSTTPPAPDSTPSAPGSEATQLALLKDNLDLVFKLAANQGKLLETAAADLAETNNQMRGTLDLLEKLIAGELADEIERLGDAVDALIQLQPSQPTPPAK